MNDAGTIVGFGTTASGETHGFVWSKANGLVDLGTLGGDFSWSSDINSSGLVAGYSKIAGGDEHAIAWSADGGLIDLGTLGGSRSRGQFVTEAGAIIGVSGAKGHRTHAFVWTEAGGMVEMPSLGRLENVDAASRTGAFTGFTLDKKSNGAARGAVGAVTRVLQEIAYRSIIMQEAQVCEPHSSPPVFSDSFSWQAFRPGRTRLRRSPGATPIFKGIGWAWTPSTAATRGAVSSCAATARTRSRPATPCFTLCDSTDRGFASFDDGTSSVEL